MSDNVPETTMQCGWILAALMMTMMLAAMDTTVVSTAIPQIAGELGGFALFTCFNSPIADELARAPDTLRPDLTHRVDAVIGALHAGQMQGAAEGYLRHAMYVATHDIYVGMVIVALCTLAVVLLTPRHFPEVGGGS